MVMQTKAMCFDRTGVQGQGQDSSICNYLLDNTQTIYKKASKLKIMDYFPEYKGYCKFL